MPLWLSISLAVCTVLALAGCVFLIFTSTPAALKRQINLLRAEIVECQVQVEAISQRWLAYKAEMETLAEAIEDNLETVEKKRKRAAASASRAARANGPELPMTPEDARLALQRQARGMGFDV
ncbi:unnamed protein product [marine sediment metagenome]|uniref:Uncharacterized protein n=1 Tax=marine sediment metagenome TaxID=412755 RepID=X1DZY1_9ZZZZ